MLLHAFCFEIEMHKICHCVMLRHDLCLTVVSFQLVNSCEGCGQTFAGTLTDLLGHSCRQLLPECKEMIAAISLGPASVTAAAFCAMTLATMSTTAATATKGANGAVCLTAFGKV